MRVFSTILAASLFIGQASSAAVVEAYSVLTKVSLDGSGPPIARTPGPLSEQSLIRELPFGGGTPDIFIGNAIQNVNGFSSVDVNITHAGFDATAANGDLTEHNGEAFAERTITYSNTSTTTAYLGSFNFRLSGMYLETLNGGGGPTIPQATIGFAAFTSTNAFVSSATLIGQRDNPRLETDGEGVLTGPIVCMDFACQRNSVTIAPYEGSLNLGVLQPSESITVTTDLFARNKWNGTEIGSLARGRDPSGASPFSATFTPVDPQQPSPVPLPAAGLLLLGALMGGGSMGRRRARET